MRRFSILFAALAFLSAGARAADKVTYDEHLLPVLREKCLSCHNADKKKGGLSMASFASLLEGGSSGAVVEPGDASASRLWLLVSHEERPVMPPESEKLGSAQLEVFQKWIAGGALENSGSRSLAKEKPKLDLALSGNLGERPEGPPPLPEGLSLDPVLVTTEPAAVVALAASPWAPLVAVGSTRQILLFDTRSLELVGVLPFEEGLPQVLRFSRSGGLLLAAGGRGGHSGRVVLFDVRTGERIAALGDEFDSVLAADLSPDQSLVALGGASKKVRIYATADGSLVEEITKHTEWIQAIEFSPDGALLATADRNGGLFIWESWTGREYLGLRQHQKAITALSWRADSNLLASAGEDRLVCLWEMERGRQVKRWNAHGGGTRSVVFARDGKLLTAGRDQRAALWDQNGKKLRDFQGLTDIALRAVVCEETGQVIAGDWRGQLLVWKLADGKQSGALRGNPRPVATELAEATKHYEAAKAKAGALAARLKELRSRKARTLEELARAKAAAGELKQAIVKSEKALAGSREETRRGREALSEKLGVLLAKKPQEGGPELEKVEDAALDEARRTLVKLESLVASRRDAEAKRNQRTKVEADLERLGPEPARLEAMVEALAKEHGESARELEESERSFRRWTLAQKLQAALGERDARRGERAEAKSELDEAAEESAAIADELAELERNLKKLAREKKRALERIERKKKQLGRSDAALEAARDGVKAAARQLATRDEVAPAEGQSPPEKKN